MLAAKVLQDEPEFDALGEEKTHELLGKAALATLKDNVQMFGLSGDTPFFDQLFNRASSLWVNAGYITKPVRPEDVKDDRFIREYYNEKRGRSSPRGGCGPEIETVEVTVGFVPGKAELTPETCRALDEKIGFLLRTHSGARFCVQVAADAGGNQQNGKQVGAAREQAIVDYLASRHNRPRSSFVWSNPDAYDGGDELKITRHILVKVSCLPLNENERAAR
jgi:hypothetical protein